MADGVSKGLYGVVDHCAIGAKGLMYWLPAVFAGLEDKCRLETLYCAETVGGAVGGIGDGSKLITQRQAKE